MGLSFRAAGTAALLAVALTGCGTETRTAPASGAGASARQDAAKAEREARARHDRMFADIAARCASADKSVDPTPSRTAADGPKDGDPQPENPKYAENHAFKQQAPMDGDALCRGTAHADRIARALTAPGGSAAPDAQRVMDELTGLGYPKESVHVSQWSDRVRFTVSVPQAGPCVTGDIVARQDIDVSPHGVYIEGGCVEPVGGH